MKNIIILLFLPLLAQGQSFKELVVAYETHCNEIVLDTVTQKGIVSYELVPVYLNEQIERYEAVSLDTVWGSPVCPEYKHSDSFYLSTGITIDGWSTGVNKQDSSVKEVSRPFVCKVKKREIKPFSDHFWNWILSTK